MTVTFDSDIGSATATSYNSIEDLKQYWFNNEFDFDDLADNDIMRLLNNATSYVDNQYRDVFSGIRDSSTQSLEFPRFGSYYIDGYEISEDIIPVEVKNATSEMAYLLSQGNDPNEIISKEGKVTAESVAVDVIKESKEYSEGSVLYQDIYTGIDSILSRITGGGSNNFTLKLGRTAGTSA